MLLLKTYFLQLILFHTQGDFVDVENFTLRNLNIFFLIKLNCLVQTCCLIELNFNSFHIRRRFPLTIQRLLSFQTVQLQREICSASQMTLIFQLPFPK